MSVDSVGSGESFDGGADSPAAEPAEPAEPAAPEHFDPGEVTVGGEQDTSDTGSVREDLSAFEPAEAEDEPDGAGESVDEPAGHVRFEPASQERDADDNDIFDQADQAAAQARADQTRLPVDQEAEPDTGGVDPVHAESEDPGDRAEGDAAEPGESEVETGDSDDGNGDNGNHVDGTDAEDGDGPDEGDGEQRDRGRDPVEAASQAHRDVMDDVQRARAEVRDMIRQANAEIADMVREANIHDVPPTPPRDWDDPEPGSQESDWEDWEEQDPDGGGDGEEVDWGKQVAVPDDFEGIPYLTQAAVDARTDASLAYNKELTAQDAQPINAKDYSQEIQPLDDMPKGGSVYMTATGMHILRAEDVQRFATEWNSHIERAEAARYSHDYAQDARPISGQGMHDLARATLAKEFDGQHYFQQALPAVANGRCDPDQLRTVLNELHPELREKYGLYQPAGWRSLPGVKDSVLAPTSSRQAEQARDALTRFVKTLPDGNRYSSNPGNPVQTGAIRLRAEAELYLRTRDASAPRPIRDARLHRLASALEAPKVQYDRREEPRGSTLKQLPRELRELYHRSRGADPRARVFRLYR
jgi:hypothetical protein